MVAVNQKPSSLTVEEALQVLEGALSSAIRTEQLRDRLTGLANDSVFAEWIESKIYDGEKFWVGLIEVDQFKNINDIYGYDDADELLKRIAGQLQNGAQDFFPGRALPIRAHGDEFFIIGEIKPKQSPKNIETSLNRIRENIASICLVTQGKAEPMKCTVSIGWLLSDDCLTYPGLTLQSVRRRLELAVEKAKQTRNISVRYSPSMKKATTKNGRADCNFCTAKFSLQVAVKKIKNGNLHCPNCGRKIKRPPSLTESV